MKAFIIESLTIEGSKMPRLREHLLTGDPLKRDRFFLEIYERANALAKDQAQEKALRVGRQVVYAETEVAEQIEQLLTQEIVQEFIAPDFKAHGLTLLREAALNWEPAVDTPKEMVGLATIQRVLLNHTLNPDNSVAILKNWQAEQFVACCENYKVHLEQKYRALEPKMTSVEEIQLLQMKMSAVDSMLTKLKETDNDGKLLPSEKRVANFDAVFSDKKELIQKDSESFGSKFVKSVLALFTQGVTAAFGIWKNEGTRLTDNVEKMEKNSIAPKPS